MSERYPHGAYSKLFAQAQAEWEGIDLRKPPVAVIDYDQPMPPMSRVQSLGRAIRQRAKEYHIDNFERRAAGLGLLPGVFARAAGGCTHDGSYSIYANEHVEWLFRQYMKQVLA